ncbi:MAG: hypothetical protein AAFY78_17425 [Cyanobacteria bacterium J06648_16]
MSLPYVLEESQIKPFNFYHKGKRVPAIIFRDHLYVLQQVFGIKERLNAYDSSYRLNEQSDVLMTASTAGYRLWADLRPSMAA